jgi:tRNA-specific 2-thiouridylase
LQAATLERTTDGLYVIFDQPQSAITPGQFVAWYHEDELLGSGVIA